ncbi:MAG: response regulator transcription factor [Eubacteriales bacterium]|nr:response regulator transcription factor [Eubacteriales bacterium]
MRILMIEDDEILCATIPFQLKQEGFAVDVAMDGEEGLYLIRERLHDLILLDRLLPGMDGMDVLKAMRREHISTPVIFLTALGQTQDRTEGLNSGADDYLGKPFAFEELLARIRSVLRRPAAMQLSARLSFGDIQYEPHTLTLSCGGAKTVLSRRLGDLLELFLRNPGQTLPRQTILLRVWGMDSDVEDGNLDNYAYILRRSLSKVGSRVRLTTVRGMGYRLEDSHAG